MVRVEKRREVMREIRVFFPWIVDAKDLVRTEGGMEKRGHREGETGGDDRSLEERDAFRSLGHTERADEDEQVNDPAKDLNAGRRRIERQRDPLRTILVERRQRA